MNRRLVRRTGARSEVSAKARSRRYSLSYNAKILVEYEGLEKVGKGALLRREGLYTSLIAVWRAHRDQGALAALAKPAGRRRLIIGIGRTPSCVRRTSA